MPQDPGLFGRVRMHRGHRDRMPTCKQAIFGKVELNNLVYAFDTDVQDAITNRD